MLALAGCDRLTISPGLLEQMEASTDEVREGGEGGGARKRGGGRERGDRERGGCGALLLGTACITRLPTVLSSTGDRLHAASMTRTGLLDAASLTRTGLLDAASLTRTGPLDAASLTRTGLLAARGEGS